MAEVANPITVMKRFELKYIISPEQAAFFRERIRGHMEVDEFGKTSIASLYYDTPDYRLIRTSLEKPSFKEKIRLRSYGLATDTSPVFLELKRKKDSIVYKRRVQSTLPLVKRFFDGLGDICAGGQINREIVYFRDLYKTLVPACLIIYDRTAWFEPGGDLRLTIDEAPRYRTKALDLKSSMDGTLLLPPEYSILEIKVQQTIPLWLASILSEGRIYSTGFSKVGEAYQQQIIKQNACTGAELYRLQQRKEPCYV